MTAKPAPPCFLLGPARSGTSMLYRTLCLHPDAAYISNYVRRLPRLPELAVLDRLARRAPDLQRETWFTEGSNAYVYGTRRSLARRLFPAPVEGEPLYGACGIAESAGPVAGAANLGAADALAAATTAGRSEAEQVRRLRRAFSRVLRADGGKVLIIKRIANNRRVRLLQTAFPQARFVRLVRDGRAVALSLSKVDWWLDDEVWWYGDTPRAWAAQGGDPWEICARSWVEELDVLAAGLSTVPAEQLLDLRYEQFVEAPGETLQTLGAFAGLAGSAAWDHQLARLEFPDRNDRWRQTLSEAALETINAVQAAHLQSLGYAAKDSV